MDYITNLIRELVHLVAICAFNNFLFINVCSHNETIDGTKKCKYRDNGQLRESESDHSSSGWMT